MFGLSSTTDAISLSDLFAGGTYQFDHLMLSDWQLVNAENVNIDNIDIGTGYYDNEFGVWEKNHELYVNSVSTREKTLSFDFLVTGIGVDIVQVKGDLGYRRISGYWWDSPWITGSIAIGTSRGDNDLGQLTDVYRLYRNNYTAWINLPDGLNQIWIRNTITLNSSSHGYAEAGYVSSLGYGPAFRNEFITQPAVLVPEPAGQLLFGIGIAVLAGLNLRRKKKEPQG